MLGFKLINHKRNHNLDTGRHSCGHIRNTWYIIMKTESFSESDIGKTVHFRQYRSNETTRGIIKQVGHSARACSLLIEISDNADPIVPKGEIVWIDKADVVRLQGRYF